MQRQPLSPSGSMVQTSYPRNAACRSRALVEDDSLAAGPLGPGGEERGCHKMLWFTVRGRRPTACSDAAPNLPRASYLLLRTQAVRRRLRARPTAPAPPARPRAPRLPQGIAGKTAADRVGYLQVALLSARQHAPSLVPVLVYSGQPDGVTRWFEEQGGHVVYHTLSFLPQFEAQTNQTWREQLLRVQARARLCCAGGGVGKTQSAQAAAQRRQRQQQHAVLAPAGFAWVWSHSSGAAEPKRGAKHWRTSTGLDSTRQHPFGSSTLHLGLA